MITGWKFSHADMQRQQSYFYAIVNGVKIWCRKETKRLNDRSLLITNLYGFNPNGIIWFSNEEKFLKFIG